MIDLSSALKNSISLQVHAHWDPIADATYNLHKKLPENVELFDLSPHEPIRKYKGETFNAFLPSSSVTVGDVWELDMELLTTPTKTSDDIEWIDAITSEEARKRLELKFYKFAEINWLPIEAAVAESEATQRPIHVVIAWGPLDDESC